MMRFNMHAQLPVTPPFRLDLTVDALRRLAANVVDIVDNDGAYFRVLEHANERVLVRVTTLDHCTLDVRASASDAAWVLPQLARMLGASADLQSWYERSAAIPWLAYLARELRGVKPPRYASLWEALAHAIVFQQISIHAAASIMRRMVLALGTGIDGFDAVAFPPAQRVLDAAPQMLRALGLSRNKVLHLNAAAEAVVRGTIRDEEIEALPTEGAIERLTTLRGIGRWSASVVMLRGFGRLDVFPMNDSGVARTIKGIAGSDIDLNSVLETLGPTRGMLYYHLLLGRIRNLTTVGAD